MTRTETERRARAQFICDAARELFAERGLENCTMNDIATAAEYTRRTLYAYFASRDELYLKIHLDDLRRRWEWQQEDLNGAEGGLARILAWAGSYIEYGRENPQSLRMEAFWDFRGVEPDAVGDAVFTEFEALNNEMAAALRGMFREGVQDGSLRDDLEIDAAVSQFLYSLRAVTHRALSGSYSFARPDPGAYLQHYLVTLTRGLAAPGGSA